MARYEKSANYSFSCSLSPLLETNLPEAHLNERHIGCNESPRAAPNVTHGRSQTVESATLPPGKKFKLVPR
jgi:hypothetical protein